MTERQGLPRGKATQSYRFLITSSHLDISMRDGRPGITSSFRGRRPPPNISSLQLGEDELAVPRICDG
jgi:hypothetical protein